MNNYGQQIPHLDLALEQWRAGTAPVAPYQPDPGMMTPPNPWAEAYASNVPPGSSTATDATSGGGGASASVPTGPETGGDAQAGGYAAPPEAFAGGDRELHLPEQVKPFQPLGGAYANVPQLAGINQTAEATHIKEQEKEVEDREQMNEAQSILDRGTKPRPGFANPENGPPVNSVSDQGVLKALQNIGIGHLGVDPGFVKSYEQAIAADDRYGNAAAANARIEGERARIQSENLGKFGEDIGKLHEKYVDDRTKVEESQEAALTDWKKGQEELGAMKIDPNRLFHDGGVPMAITTALGGILGGILGAMDGSNTNQFMNSLDKMINRDVAAQSAAIGKKRADQSDRMNLVGYWRGRLGDTYAAEQAAKASIYDQLKVKTDQLASQSQWAQAPNVAEQINAQTELRKSAALQGLSGIRQNVAAANFGAAANVAAAQATALGKRLEKQTDAAMDEDTVRKLNAGVMEGLDNGVKVSVPDSLRAPVGKQIAATRAFESEARKIIGKWDAYTSKERTAALQRLGSMARKAEEMGAYDNGVRDQNIERYGEGKTDAGEFITQLFGAMSSPKQIAEEVAHFRMMAHEAIRSAGGAYATPTRYRTKDGRVVPFYKLVDFAEAYPSYSDEAETAITPTVHNIPQR